MKSMKQSTVLKVAVALLILGGVFLWNTWVFGGFNHGIAGYTRMSISELNVTGQPFASFFSITEGLSGLFLLLGALGLLVAIRQGGFLFIALLLTASIGALTIFDATHPVDCNSFQNQACVIKMKSNQVSSTNKEHDIESAISNYAAILLALVLTVWAFVHKASGEDVPLAELVIVGTLAITIIAPLVIPKGSVVFDSIGQRAWNTLVSAEFLYIAYKVRRLHAKTR